MGVKVTVQFRNDEQGVKNLEAAYKTVASILLKHIQNENARKEKVVREVACSNLHQGK